MVFGKHRVRQEVQSPEEYKEAMKAAEVLGLELTRVDAYGYGWESPDAESISPGAGGGGVDIRKVGRKYFYMALSGPDGTEVCRVECAKAGYDSGLDDAKLVLRFN